MPSTAYRGTIPLTDANWAAVETRDARADARLRYGVRTMGVVCRPSCPSRRPNRVNVELFATADEAIALGYRACKRCRPTETQLAPVVRFTLAECALGQIVIARTPRGVCAIALGDEASQLVCDLQARFPTARLVHDDAALAVERGRVARFVDDPSNGLDLDLDLHGTAFQLAVWAALRDLPAGRTATYAEVARGLGRPHAAPPVRSRSPCRVIACCAATAARAAMPGASRASARCWRGRRHERRSARSDGPRS